MSLEQTIDNLQIRNANMVTFVGTSNTMVDTTTGRIQTKGIQHNSNVITDVSGPHGRGVATLKKYPEIEFEYGKLDANETTFTYTQAGYTVKGTNSNTGQTSGPGPGRTPWKVFSDLNDGGQWQPTGFSHDTGNNGSADNVAAAPVFGPDNTKGAWVSLELPKKIKLQSVYVNSPGTSNERVRIGKLYGSNNNSDWVTIKDDYTLTYSGSDANDTVNSTTAYKYIVFQIRATAGGAQVQVYKIRYYGYEEDPPAGDHSVDTTFKSRFNNAQTTGVQVLVDGATGVGTNQISGGPDPSGNQSTYVTDGKYWTLNGTLTSNLAVEANTFLEGDQPHAVSVWFNSSNLEANVSNTCVFSISDQEKLDSVNLDLQSNTWHNLTYSYQGEGGSRVTYLDGRKVAEDQAEDTFGDYPPFAMTGYSQGGYVVSASSQYTLNTNWNPYEAFNGTTSDGHISGQDRYTTADPGTYEGTAESAFLGTRVDTGADIVEGDWLKIEMPHKLVADYLQIYSSSDEPDSFKLYGSNDDLVWTELLSVTGNTTINTYLNYPTTTRGAFKYFALVVSKQGSVQRYWRLDEMKIYGHRENDLVRLPDPTNVLKYPHIAMTGPAQRGYVASASSTAVYAADLAPKNAFNGIISPSSATASWQSIEDGYNSTTPYNYKASSPHTSSLSTSTTQYNGEWLSLQTPHKIKIQSYKLYINSDVSNYRPDSFVLLGSDTTTNGSWNLIHTETSATYTNDVYTATVNSNTSYKYHRLLFESLAGNGGEVYINELEFYGTGVDSIPIQIGGGNIDKVANFRVYDRFIEEDQVNEIWNAQKDEFGRAKPQMVLQQGKLGIGTDAPQGSLSVADEPHNLEEFPPRAMTGYETYMEGHGVFKASASEDYTTTGNGSAFSAFGKNEEEWQTNGGTFSGGALAGNGLTTITNGVGAGPWVQLESPYKILLQKWAIQQRTTQATRHIKNAILVGSNDGYTWDTIQTITNQASQTTLHYRYYDVSSNNKYHKYLRLVITENNGGDRADVNEIKFFGTREQGQSVLHDGQLTLTKSLNVPRIGPPLDADDTPRRDRLVVEYNTSTNPTFEGAVRDTSGRGNDGVFYGDATYDASNKAITLSDGTDDYVESGKTIIARGTPQHTFSFWLKPSFGDHDDTANHYLVVWGSETAQNKWSGIALSNDGRLAHIYHSSGKRTVDQIIPTVGSWYHVVVVVNSTTATTAANRDIEIYVDGELYTGTYDVFGSNNANTAYYLDWGSGTRTSVRLGSLHAASEDSSSSLSTIKLYDVALTTEEVKTLYDMGRNGKIIPKTLQIDTPVQINAPLYAPKNVINITQSFYDGGFTTTATTLQDVYTTEWIQMRKGSEVEVDLSVLYRNDGTAWGGMYLLAFFMVDVPVGTVAANTWVAYLTPGYYMSYYQEIYEYGNTSYLPFKIPTDYKIRFKFQVRVYNNGTLYINRSHNLHFENSQLANLNQFIPMTTKRYEQGHATNGNTYYNGHTGGTKFIIKEIAG